MKTIPAEAWEQALTMKLGEVIFLDEGGHGAGFYKDIQEILTRVPSGWIYTVRYFNSNNAFDHDERMFIPLPIDMMRSMLILTNQYKEEQ